MSRQSTNTNSELKERQDGDYALAVQALNDKKDEIENALSALSIWMETIYDGNMGDKKRWEAMSDEVLKVFNFEETFWTRKYVDGVLWGLHPGTAAEYEEDAIALSFPDPGQVIGQGVQS